MITVFVLDGVVIGSGWVPDGSSAAVISSATDGATEYVVDDGSPVDVGWGCTLDAGGNPTFAAPAAQTYALLTPMQFYLAFTAKERMLLKLLAENGLPPNSMFNNTADAIPQDAAIAEFWATYQMAVSSNAHVDPNLASTQKALQYLAGPTTPTPQVITADRIPQILAGIAQ